MSTMQWGSVLRFLRHGTLIERHARHGFVGVLHEVAGGDHETDLDENHDDDDCGDRGDVGVDVILQSLQAALGEGG